MPERMFDDGASLVVWQPSTQGDAPRGFLIQMAICANIDCACREVSLAVENLERLGDGSLKRTPAVPLELDLDTGAMKHEGGPAAETAGELRKILDEPLLDFIRR